MLVIMAFFIVLTFYAILSLMGVVNKFTKKDRMIVVLSIILVLISSYVLEVGTMELNFIGWN